MKYALLLFDVESEAPADDSPEGQEEFGAWMRVSEEMAPVTEAGAPLQGTDAATTVRVRDGETVLTDGPFAETKEVLTGFFLIEAADLDEAIGWAAQIPGAWRGGIEVRPVVEMP